MEIAAAVTALGALAHEKRLEIFRLLVQADETGCAAGIIAEKLSIPKPTLSFHLKELERANIVVSKRDGRSIFYAINVDNFRDLMAYLTEECCAGRPEYCLPEKELSNCC